MVKKILMSVGIMTYEGAKRIPSELKSIEESTTERDFRIVICDDGSSEANQQELVRIVEKFNEHYGNIDLIFNHTNKGTRYTTNRCMAYHDSVYGMVWADDLLASRDWLRTWLINYRRFSEQCDVGFLGFKFNSFAFRSLESYLGRAEFSTAPNGFIVCMEKDKYWKIGGLDERVHSMFEEVEIGMKCINNNLYSIWIPYPDISHIGSVTWSHGGPKAKEFQKRYDEASNLLQNEYWGRNWSLHEAWLNFMLSQQNNLKEYGMQIVEIEEKDVLTGRTINREYKRIKTPLLLFENALIEGVLIPNYYDDILQDYISGKRKWQGFKNEEAEYCLAQKNYEYTRVDDEFLFNYKK